MVFILFARVAMTKGQGRTLGGWGGGGGDSCSAQLISFEMNLKKN